MVEDQGEVSLSNTATKTRLVDQFLACEDYALKVRKPYTITKQREKWTQEEHTKFLEALKLYGRAWPQIEEHVGNKTAVQIRSHAQKFFSKVVRDLNGEDGAKVEPIEIPPPRAKRKPTHPYPRNLSVSSSLKKGARFVRFTSPSSSGSNHENQSPNSVLCLLEHPSVSTQSLKLFGKTLFVKNFIPARAPECPTSMPFMQSRDRVELTTQCYSHDGKNKTKHKGCLLACESEDGVSGSKLKRDKYAEGFVPYKRCLAEKTTHSFMLTSEEREDIRVSLCL